MPPISPCRAIWVCNPAPIAKCASCAAMRAMTFPTDWERACTAGADMYKDKKLLRIDEVAALLDVRVQRAYELSRRGLLPVVRLGRQVRVDPDQLEAWLA